MIADRPHHKAVIIAARHARYRDGTDHAHALDSNRERPTVAGDLQVIDAVVCRETDRSRFLVLHHLHVGRAIEAPNEIGLAANPFGMVCARPRHGVEIELPVPEPDIDREDLALGNGEFLDLRPDGSRGRFVECLEDAEPLLLGDNSHIGFVGHAVPSLFPRA
jgi:hypothetical protein